MTDKPLTFDDEPDNATRDSVAASSLYLNLCCDEVRAALSDERFGDVYRVLLDEADCYREALEEIRDLFDHRSYDYQDIAREALESGKKR